eukprot:9286023-Alexandrium_andersonii.AAC.1
MSASLVGSEMCIRDRSQAGLESQSQIAGESRLGTFKVSAEDGFEQLLSCLLYTSDAADDM